MPTPGLDHDNAGLPNADFFDFGQPPASGGSEPAPTYRTSLAPRVLFATPEMADFVKTGGLGEVAGALPRALRKHHDVRVLIPGYRQVVESCGDIAVVAHLPGFADVPPCNLGFVETADGLGIYILLSAELYDRDGSPYGNAAGDFHDNDLRFARLSLAAAELARDENSSITSTVVDALH